MPFLLPLVLRLNYQMIRLMYAITSNISVMHSCNRYILPNGNYGN